METNNPYASPESNLFGGTAATSGDGVTEGVLLQLQKTKPWVRFMSVLMFIGAAFMLMGGIMMGVLGASGMMNQMNQAGGGSGAFGAGFGAGIAALYAVLAVLYIYPALKLWKYADRIRDLLKSRQLPDLEKALNEQRAFWKFCGVAMIVMLALYVVIIVVAGVVGFTAAMKASGQM